MAENTENGRDLTKDGVEEATQPQVETNQTGETETPQTSESEATPEAQATETLETMALENLEAQLESASPNVERVETQSEALQAEPETKTESPALEKSNKTRGENRYQELANENKKIKAELDQYRQAEQQRLSQKLNMDNPPWKTDPTKLEEIPLPQLNENGELTPDQYRQQVRQQAEAIAGARIKAHELEWQRQLASQQQERQLDEDMEYIKKTYPELNPDSDKYLPDLDNQVANLVSINGQLNPENLRDKIDAIMTLRSSALSKGQAQVQKILNQQAEEAALIPHQSTSQAKEDLNKVSLDDLEERLGSVS